MALRNLWDQVDGNLYAILGVDQQASDAEIVAAWRTAAKRNHPDVGGSIEAFQQAEIAYQVLSDPVERARYDRSMRATQAPSYATAGPATGYYVRYQTTYGPSFNTRPGTEPFGDPSASPAPIRRFSPWMYVLVALIAVAAIVLAVAMAIVAPVLFLLLAIWLVGRSLNPKGSRGRS